MVLSARAQSGTARRSVPIADLAPRLRWSPDEDGVAAVARDGSGWWRPVVGVLADDLRPAQLDVPPGEHLLVIGPARSGKSSALRLVLDRWRDAHPDGSASVVAPRGPELLAAGASVEAAVASVRAAMTAGRPALLVIDDAELVLDPTGDLHELLTRRATDVLVVAAARPDAIRQAYGHWTGIVRRGRLGLLTSPCSDLDGDLLGVSLPRRHPIAPRPGLVWLAADGKARLAQLQMPADDHG
jgi:S-DNA-T family DNA segregation ATPase FtsK/SpoIIIE